MAGMFDELVVAPTTSIEDVFRCLNKNKKGIVFIGDRNGRILGCVTDGDIRRQLLVKNDLSVAVSTFMNQEFVRVPSTASRENILKLLDHGTRIVPVLDSDGRLLQICSRDDFRLQDSSEFFSRARAPARISFGGGGSDLTQYFLDQGGAVISGT